VERREHQNPCGSAVKIRVHPWQKKHPASVFIRGSAQQLPGGLHPSPPAPLPCQGRGVPCALSNAAQKHKILPSPPERGRGVGGEGAWHPCHRKETRESGKERTPKPLWFIRENPCSSVAKKTPRIRVHPWLCTAASRGLHPSPPAPLPCQGRGLPCALSNATQKTQIPPLAPGTGERGRG